MPTSIVSEDLSEALADRVRAAVAARAPLKIVGGNTKIFLGRRTRGDVLDASGHRGIISYEPTELVVTTRAGTPLAEVQTLLAEHDQILAFDPPSFGEGSTIGGVVAAGLSGPGRPFAGAVRDFVLGVTVLDGRGRTLKFGGTVFKNVAGFDAFRLMAGAMGRLGVLLEVSLRVSPRPRAEISLAFEADWAAAQSRITELMRRPLPLSAALHEGGTLHIRFSGAETAVAEARAEFGGELTPRHVWNDLRHMRLGLLTSARLWRLSVPRTSVLSNLRGDWLMDWAGAQRWLKSDEPAERIRAVAAAAGGHATLFRGAADGEVVFQPLAPPLFNLHQRLAAGLDPASVLNPGRMYEGL